MNNLQYTVIIALGGAAALSVMLFDKRGRTHKPLASLIAYLIFVQMSALVIAAYMQADILIEWLLILGLAVHTGSILLAGGNVTKIQPRKETHANPQIRQQGRRRRHFAACLKRRWLRARNRR